MDSERAPHYAKRTVARRRHAQHTCGDSIEMSQTSNNRSEEFLKISSQFQLGVLATEGSHPVTANLSEVAKQDVSAALALLFEVDQDVLRKYHEFVESGVAARIQETVAT